MRSCQILFAAAAFPAFLADAAFAAFAAAV
jgi:hypothetical protein